MGAIKMHPWKRMPDLCNALGLMLGAITFLIIGYQLNNWLIIILGVLSFVFFSMFFAVVSYLFLRDYKKRLPEFGKKLFGIIPY